MTIQNISEEKQREVLGEIEKICDFFIKIGAKVEYDVSIGCDKILQARAELGNIYLSIPFETANRYEGLIRIAEGIHKDYVERRHYDRLLSKIGLPSQLDGQGAEKTK